jgi:multidrug efflux pump subunit AcrB
LSCSRQPAWRSATELAIPVLTATLTIICSFLPFLTLSGTTGEFIRALPLTVAIALLTSFIVAMMLTPMLSQFFIRKGLHNPQTGSGKQRRGEYENQTEDFPKMVNALMISLAAIYLILMFQFRSVGDPLVVMAAIPLGLLGASLGLPSHTILLASRHFWESSAWEAWWCGIPSSWWTTFASE